MKQMLSRFYFLAVEGYRNKGFQTQGYDKEPKKLHLLIKFFNLYFGSNVLVNNC